MKKSLSLLALLAAIGAGSNARAEVIWLNGLNEETAGQYAYNVTGTPDDPETGEKGDNKMSSTASAAGILSWWQDSVEKNGALIVPAAAPRGEGIWTKLRGEWKNRGTQAGHVMQYYLSGDTGYTNNAGQWLTETGLAYAASGGLYSHLLGTHLQGNDWSLIPFPKDSVVQFVDSRGYDSTSDPKAYEDGFTSYAGASKNLVEFLKQGCGSVLYGNSIMPLYAVETDDATGNITKVWFHNSGSCKEGEEIPTIQTATVKEGTNPNTEKPAMIMVRDVTAPDTTEGDVPEKPVELLTSFTLMRTQGLQFDTYGLTMTGGEKDEALFSHYLNLTVDGANYSLKYDLRNALDNNSPVDSKGQRTGDITLQSGSLTLVDSTEERQQLDGGGSTSGTISFGTASGDGDTRTLIANRSGKIADTVLINAGLGNTLEVTADNTVTFNKLAGEGLLTKTGTGTAEVTQEVTLKGTVDVQEGQFIVAEGIVADKENFQLIVRKNGQVNGKAGEAPTLAFTSGIHTNDGVLALASTVEHGAILKGSGTFSDVTMDGGTLIVGSSPGQQTYTGNLNVNKGDIVFSVSDWETAATAQEHGWDAKAYSNLVMGGNALTFGTPVAMEFAVAGDALATMLSGTGGFTMVIASGIGNAGDFNPELLAALAAGTTFYVATENGANIGDLTAGDDLTKHISDLKYELNGNALSVSGLFNPAVPAAKAGPLFSPTVQGSTPEPTTGTLSLLALAGLCARRRRK